MLESDIDILKIKPLPKKFTNKDFFIEKKQYLQLPTIIDKTSEHLIEPAEFMAKITNKIGIIDKDKIASDIYQSKLNEIKIDKPKLTTNISIENIIKTTQIITIKPFNISEYSIPGDKLTKTIKKSDYMKVYNLDDSIDLNKKLGDISYKERLPTQPEKIIIKADSYYLDNRENFIQFINSIFYPYKQQLMQEEKDLLDGKINISCDTYSKKSDFSLLTHQKIVRDYINIFTPFRGILLYHGLGSGKTCSSIAIAEGLKNDKEIIVMTPASLLPNYVEELKKCGDFIYKKNQFWEFINTNLYPDEIKYISNILKLPEKFIKDNGGAWFVNIKNKPNYDELSFEEQKSINKQLDTMINYKYTFIKYNGIRDHIFKSLSKNGTINPFSNKVIIIDEVHNFISRIVNKINNKKKSSLSIKLYKALISAENSKIIFLSGTPIINHPFEIAILYNILRGHINTYNYKFTQNITKDKILSIIKKENINIYIDNIEFTEQSKILSFTLNPFGYIKTSTNSNKIRYTSEKLNSNIFLSKFIKAFKDNNIEINPDYVKIINHTVFPEDKEIFNNIFVDSTKNLLKENNMFKMRIIGLTSYFRSAQEQLMPKYDDNINIVNVNMSDYQLGIYDEARIAERKTEQSKALKLSQKKGMESQEDDEISGTYRIFSRAFCNFVFPDSIKRPMPTIDESVEEAVEKIDSKEFIDEDVLNTTMNTKDINDKINNDDTVLEEDDIKEYKKQEEEIKDKSYSKRIIEALAKLNSDEFLSLKALEKYGPKYIALYKNIIDEKNIGIHLLYSQFKTLEGLGIFKLILKRNNFIELKLKKNTSGEYILDITDSELLSIQSKEYNIKLFASHSGDETPEERDIIKNILNNNWDLVPSKIIEKIKPIANDNRFGDIIKLLMITSSGAEGISLRNVRFVHILEPYWHPVRVQQVIGRAKRICSHNTLPIELQTVEVFLYLMTFTEEQLDKLSIETKLQDGNITTDQYLYNLSLKKENLNKDFLKNIKESSIDCNIHTRTTGKEKINCFSIGNPNENNYIYVPDIAKQPKDKELALNEKLVKINIHNFYIGDIPYGLDKKTNIIYDYDAIQQGNYVDVGKVITNEKGEQEIKLYNQ